jgi:LPS-assembly protein
MKVKLCLFLIFFVFLNKIHLLADEILFESDNIKIQNEGNIIYAYKTIAKIPNQKIEIEGDKSIYDKKNSKLTIIDNVKFLDQNNSLYIESNNIIYDQIENTIYSEGKTLIKFEDTYKITSEDVLYNRNLMKISSNLDSTVEDIELNIYNFEEGFLFEAAKEIISSKKTNIVDINNNIYFFENVKVNLKANEIIGKEVKVDFIDSFFGNEKNDPKLLGKSVISDDNKTKIFKTVFSTCNIENKNCRGWELQSEEFIHDKKEKIFQYKNSWLKVFNKKVIFLPYFSHPDPSVKRKSGFLTPAYQSSDNLGKSINIPYFYVLSEAKDMTFNPKIYSDNDFILQSEYREAFINSNLISDFSINNDENNTNTHFFAKLDGKLNDSTEFDLQIQNVTNDNYLKIHDLKGSSPLITDDSVLTSNLALNKKIDEKTNLKSSFSIYEDLSKGDSDKYQYIFPDFSFTKDLEISESYNGNFKFMSSGFQKNYETNKYEVLFYNDFLFESNNFISETGILTDYDLLLKNFNTYSENSTNYESKNDHEIYSTMLLKSKLPLKKMLENSKNYLTPVISARFSPNNTKNISGDDVRLDYNNLFSLNRIGRSDIVEGGRSLSMGVEFEKQNLSDEKIFGFNIGNVIKDKKSSNLPTKTKLDQTRSDIVGDISLNLSNNFDLEYKFSYDRDLDYSNYDSIGAKFEVNNFVTSFDYVTENHELGNSEIINNTTELKFNDEHSLTFSSTKDLKEDFTEYVNFIYQYKTDCLLALLEYDKKFYSDGNLTPSENLLFLIKFIPFAEIRGTARTFVAN